MGSENISDKINHVENLKEGLCSYIEEDYSK